MKPGIPALEQWSCAASGIEYLLLRIQQGLHDALSGLIMEAEIHGLVARNGHEFMIPNLSQRRKIKKVRNYYQAGMNLRLGTHQGRRKDFADFLNRAFRAYCQAAEELNIPPTDPFTPDAKVRATQEKLVEYMTRRGSSSPEIEISVRALAKQLKSNGLTYAELIERCRYSRRRKGRN